ncbi:MAG: cytochrome ubiquinol oxidase subunit I [Bacteroidales bacterium]|nr:cytochrome ubiquinol oxidase subunit I [Bacteroidales bacterium]
MNELIGTIDWSRAQFALTAMYHWLFVPLTIGLALIVAIMETIYVRTGQKAWKGITKFWMTLFGINFACGIATGLILEFQFGTNWSNYSWFVGDIFGAPLAIEGLFAFFLEATFVAVMFFGWNKVGKRFHLTATWLTAIGVTLSAFWILVANAWMQNPVGMEFDPTQMRNVMTDFWAVAFNSVAINKFFHAVFSGWTLAGVFVCGISCWMLWRRRNIEAARRSIKTGAWVGLAGLLLTMYTGHGSAVEVARVQPMKLAAMEGLYDGHVNEELILFGIYNSEIETNPQAEPIKAKIAFPGGLSFLANGKTGTFVPGINDLIEGREITPAGDTINTISYRERMSRGAAAQQALRDYDQCVACGDTAGMEIARKEIAANYQYFGYGFLNTPEEAIPPVGLTFYSFHIMVALGMFLLLFFLVALYAVYRRPAFFDKKIVLFIGLLSIPAVWICSQAGWIVAEVGRQPWIVQDKMTTGSGISDIGSGAVQTTFWIFAILFTLLLVAEISIMLRQISRRSKKDIQNDND